MNNAGTACVCVPCWSPTFRKQKVDGAQVALAGRHHEERPALLVAYVDVGAALQQQLRNLEGLGADSGDRAVTRKEKRQLVRLTCQCPCLTAQNRGDTPLWLTCCTTAPCSNRTPHTSIFPRPAAAVRAAEVRAQHTGEIKMQFKN